MKSLRLAMVATLITGSFALASTSASSPVKKPTGKANASNTNTAAVVTALHQAKKLLDTAIHDYDGHRGKAVEEIHHAIKELTPHTSGNKAGANATKTGKAGASAGKTGAGKTTTTPGETQAQSDAQLAEALKILSSLEIPNTHPKAITHLQTAVTELNTALKIK